METDVKKADFEVCSICRRHGRVRFFIGQWGPEAATKQEAYLTVTAGLQAGFINVTMAEEVRETIARLPFPEGGFATMDDAKMCLERYLFLIRGRMTDPADSDRRHELFLRSMALLQSATPR